MLFFKKSFSQKSHGNKETWIIAGLGNPGPEYSDTRHNCGFLAIDALSGKLGIELTKKKFKGIYGEGERNGQRIILLKPLTYMNNSGECIQEIMNWYKVKPGNLIVMYDDCDLPMAALRVRGKGSAGTHNGMRSVLRYVEGEEFPRIRIGIGKQKNNEEIIGFVLGHFNKEDMEEMNKAFAGAAEAAICILDEGVEKAMSKHNRGKNK